MFYRPVANGNYGELIPLVYRKIDPLDPNAGNDIFKLTPATPPNDVSGCCRQSRHVLIHRLGRYAAYYPDRCGKSSTVPLGTGGAGTPEPCPRLQVFGGATNTARLPPIFKASIIVPGSERVQGPDNALSVDPSNSSSAVPRLRPQRSRISAFLTVTSSQNKRVDQRIVQKQPYSGNDPEQFTEVSSRWARNSNLTYYLETNLGRTGAEWHVSLTAFCGPP